MQGLKEAAKKLGVNPTRLRALCVAKRIKGAKKVAGVWVVPDRLEIIPGTRYRPGKLSIKGASK